LSAASMRTSSCADGSQSKPNMSAGKSLTSTSESDALPASTRECGRTARHRRHCGLRALWRKKGRLSRSTSRTEELTSKDSVEAQRSW
jgi:hypothetical protein